MLEAVICDNTWNTEVASGSHSSAVSQVTHHPNFYRDTEVTRITWIVGEGNEVKGERLSWDTGRKGNGLQLAEDIVDQLLIVSGDETKDLTEWMVFIFSRKEIASASFI